MQGFEGFLLKKWSKKGGRFLDSLTFRGFARLGTKLILIFRLSTKFPNTRPTLN